MLLPALLLLPALALPVPVPSAGLPTQAQPVQLCTPTDSALGELSGLGVRGEHLLAVGDGGRALRVAVLDAACATVGELSSPDDPRDVEDMAVAADGTVWLADIGDNDRDRDTVALFGVRPGADGTSSSSLHRLTYPDGPHDAEALLLARSGRPVIVTKELSGSAGVYAPGTTVDQLPAPGPTELERVGTVQLVPTTTPGGPPGGIGSLLVTGGAVSADGTVAALRTYTDAYLFTAPDGDVVAALGRTPVRVPLPAEPQGEAIAFTAGGALLSGSESAGGALPPVRSVAGATAFAAGVNASDVTAGDSPQAQEPDEEAPTSPDTTSGVTPWQAGVVAVLVAGLLVWLFSLLSKRRRR